MVIPAKRIAETAGEENFTIVVVKMGCVAVDLSDGLGADFLRCLFSAGESLSITSSPSTCT